MANPVEFPGQNSTFTLPSDASIKELPVARTKTGVLWSCWQLDGDELMEVLQTGRIWLACAGSQPPVLVVGQAPEFPESD